MRSATLELRALLNAEGQLVKALPKAKDDKAARAESLKFALEHHLEETKEQVERLKEVFRFVGATREGQAVQGHGVRKTRYAEPAASAAYARYAF